jgi:hypothetical protein
MKTKLIYAGGIALIFLTAMFIYRDTLTLEGVLLIIGANITSIKLLWLWLNKKEETNNLKQENHALRAMHKAEFRKNQPNKNAMTDTEAEVILAQLNYVNNTLSATHQGKQVHIETIENFQSVIGGGGIKNPPPA